MVVSPHPLPPDQIFPNSTCFKGKDGTVMRTLASPPVWGGFDLGTVSCVVLYPAYIIALSLHSYKRLAHFRFIILKKSLRSQKPKVLALKSKKVLMLIVTIYQQTMHVHPTLVKMMVTVQEPPMNKVSHVTVLQNTLVIPVKI